MRDFRLGTLTRNLGLILLSVLWLVPTYLLLVNAMTAPEEYTGSPRWLPGGFDLLDNVETAWGVGGFGPAVRNSVAYAFVSAGAAVLIAALAAYAVAVLPIRRPTAWFWLIYTGTLLPLQVFARPLFVHSVELDLYDTWAGLGVAYVAICIPFAFFVVRNFIITLPPELSEAARLDGTGWARMFWSIHLPRARPALAAAFVFQFVWVWNELFFAITLSISPEVQPVMAALARLQQDTTAAGPPIMMAATLMVSMPTIFVFFVFQRFFEVGMRSKL